MKKSLFTLTIFLYSVVMYAQSGPHSPYQTIIKAFFNTDQTRLLTLSYTDVTLWNYQQKKPIWTKKASELGDFYISTSNAITVDKALNFMIKENPEGKTPRRTLIDLNTLRPIGWGWYEYQFAANGFIPARDYGKEKNQNIFYLIDPKTLEKEKIAENLDDIKLINNNNVVEITVKDKQGKVDESKTRYYGITSKKMVNADEMPLPIPFPPPFKRLNIEVKTITLPDKKRQETVICTQNGKEIKSFALANPVPMSNAQPLVVSIFSKANSVTVLEHKPLDGQYNMVLSFLNTYNYLTGQLLNSLELSSATPNAIAAAKALQDKAKTISEEKMGIANLPENQIKQKVNMLAFNGSYVINQKTLRIYKLQPEKGAYQGGMVSLEAITSAGNQQAFEKIDNLENKTMYKSIKEWKVCPYCQGKGITQTEHVKEIDQTYSKGRIITQTTTTTKGCSSCGGGGVIPN